MSHKQHHSVDRAVDRLDAGESPARRRARGRAERATDVPPEKPTFYMEQLTEKLRDPCFETKTRILERLRDAPGCVLTLGALRRAVQGTPRAVVQASLDALVASGRVSLESGVASLLC